MNIIFFVLFAALNYNVAAFKVRAVRKRVIQYIPYNLNAQKSQLPRWLPKPQIAPIYQNSRIIYYTNPGGARFKTIGGRETYADYAKNSPNWGPIYQNLPNSGNYIGQNGLNSGYNGLSGLSAYQSWQNSAHGNPIDISVEQRATNPGYRGHVKQSVYQSWQNSGGSPVDISVQNDGNGVQQSLQYSASENLINHPAYPTILNTEFNGSEQSQFLNWQNSGNAGGINIPVDQSATTSAHGKKIEYSEPHSVPSFGQNSENGDQDVLPLYQGEINGELQPQFNNVINEVKANPEENSVSENFITYQEIKQPNAALLQDNVKDIQINNEETIIPIETKNDIFSPGNKDKFIIDEIKPNWDDQNPLKQTQYNKTEGNIPGSDATEGDLVVPNYESLISIDQSNKAEQTPLEDTDEENVGVNISPENDQISPNNIENTGLLTDDLFNNEQESAPISFVPENDLISTDAEGQVELQESTRAPHRKKISDIGLDYVDDFGPMSLTENNPISLNKILLPNDDTYQEQQTLPSYPDVWKPYQQQNQGYITPWNQISTTRQRQTWQTSHEMQPGNVQWRNPIVNNVSPKQVYSMYSSSCQNPTVNVIPEKNIYGARPDWIRKMKEINLEWFPPTHNKRLPIYMNRDTPIIMKPNGGHTNKKIYDVNPYYQQGKVTYEIPQPNPDIPPRPHVRFNLFNDRPENFEANYIEGNEVNEDTINIKPDNFLPTFAPDKPWLGSQPMIPDFPGSDNSKLLLKMTPKQFVYQVTEAFMPKLLSIYYSKCDNGEDEKLLKEITKLIDSVKLDHCEI